MQKISNSGKNKDSNPISILKEKVDTELMALGMVIAERRLTKFDRKNVGTKP
jgi:hypothetical protein